MGMVRSLCSRCLYLKAGRVIADGSPEEIIEAYEQHQVSEGQNGVFRQPSDDRYPLQVLEVELRDEHGQRQTSAIDQFSPLYVWIHYVVRRRLVGCNICVAVAYRGTKLFLSFDTDEEPALHGKRNPGHYEATIPLPTEALKAGSYTIGLDSGTRTIQPSRAEHQFFDKLLDVRDSRGIRHVAEGLCSCRGRVNGLPVELEYAGVWRGHEQFPRRCRAQSQHGVMRLENRSPNPPFRSPDRDATRKKPGPFEKRPQESAR